MAKLKEEYKSFLDDIEKNIKNKEDLAYVKKRFSSFLDVVIEQLDDIMKYKEEKIENIEKIQTQLEQKMENMQNIINNIERDIYAEDGFDFEIVCPYCNHEFVIDVDENKTEIECPKCENTIELDWSGDPENEGTNSCMGSCSHCRDCDEQDEQETNQEPEEDDDM